MGSDPWLVELPYCVMRKLLSFLESKLGILFIPDEYAVALYHETPLLPTQNLSMLLYLAA